MMAAQPALMKVEAGRHSTPVVQFLKCPAIHRRD